MKEMVVYSATKSYMEKNKFHCFTFSPNSEKPMKSLIHHLPPDMQTEDISSSLEDVCFNIINVRQMMVTRAALNGKPMWLYSLLP
jgi:hypothetical protein